MCAHARRHHEQTCAYRCLFDWRSRARHPRCITDDGEGQLDTDPVTFDAVITPNDSLQTFDGVFDVDNDVALWRFFLGDGVFQFSAATTSGIAGRFDPLMSALLFRGGWRRKSVPPRALRRSRYSAIRRRNFDDGADGDVNSAFSLTLATRGFYISALTQALNNHQDGPAGTTSPA